MDMNSPQPAVWRPLGRVVPQALASTRLDLHWAVQIPTAGAITLLPHQPDYSHTALTWHPTVGALLTHPVSRGGGFRMGLRPADMAVVLVDHADAVTASFPLANKTLQEGYDALGRAVSDIIGQGVTIAPSDYSLPDHPVNAGGRWPVPDRAKLTEFAHLYHNADAFLRAYRARTPGASPVVVWPHHFDIASITVYDPDEADPEEARSIGVGLSPGDETYAEPYVYVLPWPHLPAATLPALGPVGHWHTQGFVAAILTAGEWLTSGDPEAQESTLAQFVDGSVAAAKKGLGLTP